MPSYLYNYLHIAKYLSKTEMNFQLSSFFTELHYKVN